MKPVRPVRQLIRTGKLSLKITLIRFGPVTFSQYLISLWLPSCLLYRGTFFSKGSAFRGNTHPTDEWTAQQLREATGFGQGPKYLIRDNDRIFGQKFQRVAQDAGIEILKTPIRAPKANSICERFQGSVRRESLNHLFIWSERQLQHVLKQYVQYFNGDRPHQGIGQAIPQASTTKIA